MDDAGRSSFQRSHPTPLRAVCKPLLPAVGPLDGPVGDRRSIGQIQLFLDMIPVGLNRVGAHAKFLADLTCAQSAANESENLQLPGAQPTNAGDELRVTGALPFITFFSGAMTPGVGGRIGGDEHVFQHAVQFTRQHYLMLLHELLNRSPPTGCVMDFTKKYSWF